MRQKTISFALWKKIASGFDQYLLFETLARNNDGIRRIITICNHPEIVGIPSQLRLSNRSATLIQILVFEAYPTQH